MELTFDYINEHLSEFEVDTNLGVDRSRYGYGFWNDIHGEWQHDVPKDKIANIKYIYAIMPYLDNDKISGNKVVKGFIIKSYGTIGFTSEDTLNKYFHSNYGHTIWSPEDGSNYANTNCKYAANFRMFTNKDEAKEALKQWKNKNETVLLNNELSEIEKRIDSLRTELSGLYERKEDIIKKIDKLKDKSFFDNIGITTRI